MVDRNGNRGLPRTVELCLAVLGLAVAVPLMTVAAVMIKLTSRGPAIFRQRRVGRNGGTFTLFKLRTMGAGPGSLVTAAHDVRVTAVGKFLRRYKIDELPQLWNVIRGDMGIVGPRPEIPDLVDVEDPRWREILCFRPGLTDPMAIRLRNEEQLLAKFADDDSFYKDVVQPYKLRGYLNFLRSRTVGADVAVIFHTAASILFPNTTVPPSKEEMLWSLAE